MAELPRRARARRDLPLLKGQVRESFHRPFITAWLMAEYGNCTGSATAPAASAQGLRLKREARRAESAVDPDHPVVTDHRRPLVLGEARDHRADIDRVAAAAARKRRRGQGPHLLLVMEQPPAPIVERQPGIGQLLRLARPAE